MLYLYSILPRTLKTHKNQQQLQPSGSAGSSFADFWRGSEQHPHHRRSGEGEEFCGHVRGPAGRPVPSGLEEGQRVRRLLRLRPVRRLLDQLSLVQVRRLPGAARGASLQPGVQVRGETGVGDMDMGAAARFI